MICDIPNVHSSYQFLLIDRLFFSHFFFPQFRLKNEMSELEIHLTRRNCIIGDCSSEINALTFATIFILFNHIQSFCFCEVKNYQPHYKILFRKKLHFEKKIQRKQPFDDGKIGSFKSVPVTVHANLMNFNVLLKWDGMPGIVDLPLQHLKCDTKFKTNAKIPTRTNSLRVSLKMQRG